MLRKKFIKATEEYCSFDRHVNAPCLRRSFQLDFRPEQAEISICGLGFYRLFINGEEITKGFLAPYISNPDHYCYYDTYQVGELLRQGENVIAILLGNGFQNAFGGAIWDFDKAEGIGAPKVALEFLAEGEGRELRFEADEDFRVHPSPILFDEYRMGEHYDARLELPGWDSPGFDDSGWGYALPAETPRGKLKLCEAEPIRTGEILKPVSVTETEDGYLYDFGVDATGLTELRIQAQAGQEITLWHCEVLKDGKFYNRNIIFDMEEYPFYHTYNQKTVYIAKGEGTERYMPGFAYYGFRYVLVQGITPKQATVDLLTFYVIHSDLHEIGGFQCSDETANTLFGMVKRADLSNLHYFPTDCPHREKCGWTGDASISSDHMAYLFDLEKTWREWLHNIRKAQNAEGFIPGIVPTYGWGYALESGPGWDNILFDLPYLLYKYRGNLQVIRENANAFVRWLEYILKKRNPDGTVSCGNGDMVMVRLDDVWREYDVPLAVCDSILVMDAARKAEEMLRAVGYELPARFAGEVYREMRKTIRTVLMDPDTLEIAGKCQTGQAMALYYGVFEKEEEERAFAHLLRYIRDVGDNFSVGILGMKPLFHVLSENGQGELAFHMITKRDYPSYGFLIEEGYTSLPEEFFRKGIIGDSHNHHFFGDIGRWFIARVAGLLLQDTTHVEIRPDYIAGLDFAEAFHELPAGKVTVRWEKKGDREYLLKITCPAEVECAAFLPEGYETTVCRDVM